MTQGSNNSKYGNFPDPFASPEEKAGKAYGLKFAKSIEGQWGSGDDNSALFSTRLASFEKNRDYANGTQDTSIYRQILNSLDPNNGDGTLLNLDWSPVPIIPKFVRVVVNRILSRKPYPSVEAIDPISKGEKDQAKAEVESAVDDKALLQEAKSLGLTPKIDPDILPDSSEEASIFLEHNIKTNAEIAAQLGTALTLDWNDFDQTIFRRCVEDLVVCGMGVVKRENDPNYGITEKYIDPAYFLHSQTDDPNMSDIMYAANVKKISIQELKRQAGDTLTEAEFEKLGAGVKHKSYNDSAAFTTRGKQGFGYDDYLIDVMDFEFLSVDCVYYERKESQFGNTGFYYKGSEYKDSPNSVYGREPHKMENQTVYGGSYVMGAGVVYNYGPQKNVPKNIHDLTKATLSYSVACTNIRRMQPNSIVSGIIGFADQLQLTHLKIQQAIAKAKPDGVLVDIEGLENVQLGRGGDLQPLEIQDIYEQTGVFYYRSKNPEGGFQNPPIRSIENNIRNINEYINLYNHYLRMIRDSTGINEVMDASTPKGDALVGVRQQAMAAGNNALYDITNASMTLYRRVCQDIVKCLQVIPSGSVLYKVYSKAIGEVSMETLSSFNDLPMYNFGVMVVQEMSDEDRVFLEQNLQASLAQREIDLEDAMAVRQVKDVEQAQRLLAIKRKKRMQILQQQQQQNIQAQAQANSQATQQKMQMEMQSMQTESQMDIQKIQLKGQVEVQVAAALHQMKKELELIRAQATLGMKTDDKEFREKIENLKEDRKDGRVERQAVEQSKLISQRKGERGELEGGPSQNNQDVINEIFGNG
tara:strand:- start:472 stop:2907 length:2436 start_codon:yes stop_codon:yes gene_type:complete